jgi:hypothetical protein
MKVLYANDIQLSPKHKFYKALCTFLSFIIFAVYVYIPFQFYGLLNTFKREIFFELKIKKRFNCIIICLIKLKYLCLHSKIMILSKITQMLYG